MTVEPISEPLYRIVLKKSEIETNGISPLLKGLALENLQIVEGHSYMDKEKFLYKFQNSIVHNTKIYVANPKNKGKKYNKTHMYFNPCPTSVGRYQRRNGYWIYPNGHQYCIVPRKLYHAVIVMRLAPQFRAALKDEFKGLREAFINPLVKVARILPMLIRHVDPVVYRRPKAFSFIPGFEAIECYKHNGFKKKSKLQHILKHSPHLSEAERSTIEKELKKLPKILKCDANCKEFKKVKSDERRLMQQIAQNPNIADAWVDSDIKDIFSLSIYY